MDNGRNGEEERSFWRDQGSAVMSKLPGRVMKTNSNGSSANSKPSTPTRQGQHRRNNSTSFELFAASCDDAWDSNIDDGVGGDKEALVKSSAASSTRLRRSSSDSRSSSIKSAPGSANLCPKDLKSVKKSTESSKTTLAEMNSISDPKLAKFKRLLHEDEVTDLNQLRSLSWAGIPGEVRPLAWKMLLGYLPAIRAKREQALERKRAEYQHLVHQYYNNKSTNDEMWRQIHIDIPRMQPLISIFQQEVVQRIFERILYIWSIRHPASGYVQGMNDLLTPFFVVYLSEFIPGHSLADVESFEVSSLPDDIIRGVEADSFWSFSKLLDSIQDNYTFAQPGIQKLINLLSRVMSRVDSALHEHLARHSVQYLQFAFRWMNNLLIRELPLRCIVRLWDTYLAEGAVTSSMSGSGGSGSNVLNVQIYPNDSNTWSFGDGTPFASSFHLYVCAAFLRFWSKNLLREDDFQGLMLLLQNLPTFHWTENEIKLMVADAYQLKYTFTPNHLNS
ncbi:TBC1 domain family member 22B [Halotydeus destructor]|nr:TBC1 domain family member 22B [Halotydeus destructor]